MVTIIIIFKAVGVFPVELLVCQVSTVCASSIYILDKILG